MEMKMGSIPVQVIEKVIEMNKGTLTNETWYPLATHWTMYVLDGNGKRHLLLYHLNDDIVTGTLVAVFHLDQQP